MLTAKMIADAMDAGPAQRARIVAALATLRTALAFKFEAWSAADGLHVTAMKNCNLDAKVIDLCQPAGQAGWNALETFLFQRGV